MKKLSLELLADKVYKQRKLKKMSQQDVSEKTGINRSMLSHLEAGNYSPSIAQLEALEEVLDFDVLEILVDSDEKAEEKDNSNLEKVSPLNIAVAGTGYVGLSLAVLLAQHNHVTAVDIIPEKVDMINNRKSPIQDDYIEKYLAEKELDLTATLDGKEAYKNADFA